MNQIPFERSVLDALPLTIWTTDLEGRVTSTNRAWDRFAVANGAPALAEGPAILGRVIWTAFTDDASRDQVKRAMQLLGSGRSERVVWEFPCSSPDEERIFLLQVTALRDAGADGLASAVTGFVFSTVDITPSHHSREVLLDAGIALARPIDLARLYVEVGEQVRRAVRCNGVSIALADDESAALTVQYHYGYDDDTAELERRLKPTWLDALANQRVFTGAYRDGVEITAPMTSAEGVLGAITIWSQHVGSPQDLEAAERLLASLAAQTSAAIERAWLVRRVEQKRRLEAIGEVSAGVAHELRNPLFGISAAAQLLRHRAGDDAVVLKNVGRILKEVDRLNRMVTSLLEYGRPVSIHPEPGDPDAVWDDVVDSQRALIEASGLTLIRTRPSVPTKCAIDAEQLAQVFLNVLVNACDAAPPGTALTLQTVVHAGAWRMRLHNGGPAIPPEVLPRVFEIFFSTKSGGTGIGLALCQRIVEEHGGTISIESDPDHGTTLTITLPALV